MMSFFWSLLLLLLVNVCVESNSNLLGKHGGMKPDNETNNSSRNHHKLVVYFNNTCVTTKQQAKTKYNALANDFGDCLVENTNRTKNVYQVPIENTWHGYYVISDESCLDILDVDYDAYCVESYEFEQVLSMDGDVSCSKRSAKAYDGTAAWHLDDIDSVDDNKYNYVDYDRPQKVDIYILDSGVQSTHVEFSNIRVFHLGSDWGDDDIVSNHGTHVAGIAGGDTVGVAHGLNIYEYGGCRLAGGYCSLQDIEDGFEAVITRLGKKTARRGVINMSFGDFGGCENNWQNWMEEITDLGGIILASAGNSGTNGCGHFPSTCNNVISVGAYTDAGKLASYSNYGSCVDVYGPGSAVYSSLSSKYSDSDYYYKSGTSMASPAMTGIVANMLVANPDLTYSEVRTILRDKNNGITLGSCSSNKGRCNGFALSCEWILDEVGSSDGGSNCASGQFECGSCCIDSGYQNDGWCDCKDCSDESSWNCNTCGNGCGGIDVCVDDGEHCGSAKGASTSARESDTDTDGHGEGGISDASVASDSSSSSSGGVDNNSIQTTFVVILCVGIFLLFVVFGALFIRKRWLNNKMRTNVSLLNKEENHGDGYVPPIDIQTNETNEFDQISDVKVY